MVMPVATGLGSVELPHNSGHSQKQKQVKPPVTTKENPKQKLTI
jgi:hypothetical protein